MTRGKQLQELIQELRVELRETVGQNKAQINRENYRVALVQAQEDLWLDWDWPFARVFRDENLQAGQRYYAFPTDLDPDRVHQVWVKDADNDWQIVVRGIEPSNYNIYDSEGGNRQSEMLSWDFYEQNQYEVWPVPDDDSYTLRFEGIRKLPEMVKMTDTATLDNRLIVQAAAVKLLSGRGSNGLQQAQVVQARLDANLRKIRSQLGGKSQEPVRMFSRNPWQRRLWPGIDYIPPRS